MAKDLKAKVVVQADVREAERALAKLQKSFAKFGSYLTGTFEQDTDAAANNLSTEFIKATASAEKSLKGLSDTPVKITADSSGVSSEAKKAEKSVDAIKQKTPVKVSADASDVSDKAKKAKKAVDSIKQKTPVKIKADTSQATSALTRLKASAEALQAPFAKVQAGLSKAMVPVAVATASVYGLKKAFDAVKEGATLDAQTEALKRNVEAQGVAWDGYIAKLAKVSQAQVANADIVRAASSAMLLGIPAEKMSELMEVAAASAVATGRTISESFNDLAVGIGRASPMILDNLGLVVKLGPVYQEFAAEVGKTVEELTAEEKKLALLNSVLEVGQERVTLFAGAQDGAAKATAEFSAAIQNQTDNLKRYASEQVGIIASLVRSTGELKTENEALRDSYTDAAAGAEEWSSGAQVAMGVAKAYRKILFSLHDAFWDQAKASAAVRDEERQRIEQAKLATIQMAALKTATDQLSDAQVAHLETSIQLGRVNEESAEVQSVLAKAMSEVEEKMRARARLEAKVVEVRESYNLSTREAIVMAKELIAAEDESAKAKRELAKAAEKAANAQDGLNESLGIGATSAERAAAAESELAEKIKELGILTGGEVAEAQEEHIRLLDTQARLTGINSIEYERLAGALSNEIRELRESTTAQDALNLAQAEGGTAAGGYATSVIKSSDALRDFGNIAAGTQRQVEAMADSMRNAQGVMLQNGSRLPTAPGGGMGGGVGGGTFSGFTPISEFTDSQWATYSRLTGVTKSMWHTQNSQWS